MQVDQKSYKSWYRAVHRAYNILHDQGYEVIRAMSGDSKFQLLAYDENKFLFIQVRLCTAKRLPSYEKTIEELAKTKTPDNSNIELWVYEGNRGFHFFTV